MCEFIWKLFNFFLKKSISKLLQKKYGEIIKSCKVDKYIDYPRNIQNNLFTKKTIGRKNVIFQKWEEDMPTLKYMLEYKNLKQKNKKIFEK